MKMFRTLPLVTALSLALSLPASAQSLVDLYGAARSFDATYQSADVDEAPIEFRIQFLQPAVTRYPGE